MTVSFSYIFSLAQLGAARVGTTGELLRTVCRAFLPFSSTSADGACRLVSG